MPSAWLRIAGDNSHLIISLRSVPTQDELVSNIIQTDVGAAMGASKSTGKALVLGAHRNRPQQRTGRRSDWTPEMSAQFIETLSETCNVTLAAAAIGRSISNVYKWRGKDATFRAQWEQALAIGYSRLEMMLLERALHGVEKVVVAKDGSTSVMTEYPDRVALTLLRMHRDSVASSEQPIDEQEYVEARDRILARIERIRVKKGIRFETKGFIQLKALLRRPGPGGGRREARGGR